MTETETSSARTPSRRVLIVGAAAAVAAAGVAYYMLGRPVDELERAASKPSGPADLMAPGPLAENVLGDSGAPVTIIEYSSMTCPHCARFHETTLPRLKEKYIDTGKARYIIREFPLDNLAAAAFMLARCVDKDRYFTFVDVMYAKQREWAFGEGEAVDRLFNLARQAGFTRESFDACLSDQKTLDGMMEVRERGGRLGVTSTPTFFVNGKLLKGGQTLEEFEKLMPADIVSKTS